jgi:HSP20 family protein
MFQNSWMPTLFEDFLNNDWMPRARSAQWDACLSKNSTAPAVNVKESEKAYTMELAAPGIKKEYCRVSINDEGNLTIAIENKAEHKHEDKHHHYLRREFSYSNYEQNYTLPDDVVRDQISAKVEDGILTITMPKAEAKQKVTKAIEVS